MQRIHTACCKPEALYDTSCCSGKAVEVAVAVAAACFLDAAPMHNTDCSKKQTCANSRRAGAACLASPCGDSSQTAPPGAPRRNATAASSASCCWQHQKQQGVHTAVHRAMHRVTLRKVMQPLENTHRGITCGGRVLCECPTNDQGSSHCIAKHR